MRNTERKTTQSGRTGRRAAKHAEPAAGAVSAGGPAAGRGKPADETRAAKEANLPEFPYGAVYYRVSNPPREDWERDYRTAAADGNNIFRHWFLWSAIERSPGEYTWDDYDRQLDLAAEHGIKTIIAEMMTVAPEWTARLHPHARLETAEGRRSAQAMHGSCATGGIDMCLDNEDLRGRAEEFLQRLAERYRDHPGLGGYDIWNECNMAQSYCFCNGTIRRFREWVERQYGNLEGAREAWRRPGMATWEDVTPPRALLPYADSLDWLQFRIENAYELMRWRADTIAAIDPYHRITAHALAVSLRGLASKAADEWRAAGIVDSFGLTWGSSRHGDEPWKQPQAVDLIRNASRGKPIWHAEAYGGPLWLQSNVFGKPRDAGRICYPEDIRYWNLTSYMHGVTGTLYLRWRPLLDGPLFGAFGPYGMDGSRTARSEMSTAIGRWVQAPEQRDLRRSRPVRGEIGILVNPETQLFSYAQHRDTEFYGDCYEGAYRGFYDNSIQADFVNVEDIDEWDFLYLPYPVMLSGETAGKLTRWVEAGGTLVSEGCPGYWGDRGHVGRTQPNLGLDELFGARQTYVEFTPDLLTDLEMNVLGARTYGGVYLQTYEPTGGEPEGWFVQESVERAISRLVGDAATAGETGDSSGGRPSRADREAGASDGRGPAAGPAVAAVANRYGAGRTLLIGSMPSRGYFAHDGAVGGEFFRRVFEFGPRDRPYVTRSDARIRARIHDGDGGTYLWVANHTRRGVPVTVSVNFGDPVRSTRSLRGPEAELRDGEIALVVPARDVVVLQLSS